MSMLPSRDTFLERGVNKMIPKTFVANNTEGQAWTLCSLAIILGVIEGAGRCYSNVPQGENQRPCKALEARMRGGCGKQRTLERAWAEYTRHAC
eukprot:3022034-Amphidinium_carterae.1